MGGISEDQLQALLESNSHISVSASPTKTESKKYAKTSKKSKGPSKRSDLELRCTADLKNLGFPQPELEVVFFPTRKWRLDFYWPAYKLALEIDGGTYTHGKKNKSGNVARSGHLTPLGYHSDCTKGNHVAMIGCSLLRADSDMVTKGEIYPQLEESLKIRGWDGKREKWK